MKELGKYIGAGISCIGLGGAGIGAGLIFHGLISATGKKIELYQTVLSHAFLCFSLIFTKFSYSTFSLLKS